MALESFSHASFDAFSSFSADLKEKKLLGCHLDSLSFNFFNF